MDGHKTRHLERHQGNNERNKRSGNRPKKKKTKRPKPIKNQLKGFTLYYLNIRDIATKKSSLQEILNKEKPSVIAIAETWLEEDEVFELEGYEIFRNDRNKDGGGVLIAVKNVLANITVEVSKTKEIYESLWVVINNGRVKIKLGAVYLPQEKPLNDKELNDVYKLIKTEIQQGKEKDQCVIVAGDFNCRVGEAKVKGTYESESKGGKKLLDMIDKEKMILANASDKCNGLWTREENGKRSVIDFILMEEEDEDYIESLEIDESKSKAPFRLKSVEGGNIQTVYSDHNPMILKTNLILKEKEKRKNLTRTMGTMGNNFSMDNEPLKSFALLIVIVIVYSH